MQHTKFTRIGIFSSIILAVFLSLLSLCAISLYFANDAANSSASISHSNSPTSANWQLINLEKNTITGQIASYFGIYPRILQEILPVNLAGPTAQLGRSIVTSQRTFQQVVTFMLGYPVTTANANAATNRASATPGAHQRFIPIQSLPTQKLFFLSSEQAAINPQIYLQLQNIFKNVVQLDPHLRHSERFNVIYDHAGHILLATVTLHHQTLQAIRYTNSKGITGYYTPSGHALFSSAFLTAPVKYTRISDGFTLHRWHPILHLYRPHYGIDYAAPTGTPIHAVSDGRISFVGWGGGYGNAVVIRHDNSYQSLYAHMSRFAASVKPGQWVRRGDIIGFVGSTGLATGPHLHFGLYQYGKPLNPSLILPKTNRPLMVSQRDLPDFLVKANQLLTRLAFVQNRNVANG